VINFSFFLAESCLRILECYKCV